MIKKKIAFGVLLIILGLIGIASLLTMEIPLPPEAEEILKSQFTSGQIKLLILINPTILLIVAVIIGTVLYQRVHLKVPLIEKVVGLRKEALNHLGIIYYGISGGVLAGVLIGLISLAFNPVIPAEFMELGKSLQPSLAVRFLYGGFTEEILMRFGLMTLIVWLSTIIFNGTNPIVYWSGILISAIIFAIGHFPIAYQAVENPTIGLLTYLLIGNSVGGIIFGWLYWKKGLECTFIAHISTHLIIVLAEPILS